MFPSVERADYRVGEFLPADSRVRVHARRAAFLFESENRVQEENALPRPSRQVARPFRFESFLLCIRIFFLFDFVEDVPQRCRDGAVRRVEREPVRLLRVRIRSPLAT